MYPSVRSGGSGGLLHPETRGLCADNRGIRIAQARRVKRSVVGVVEAGLHGIVSAGGRLVPDAIALVARQGGAQRRGRSASGGLPRRNLDPLARMRR